VARRFFFPGSLAAPVTPVANGTWGSVPSAPRKLVKDKGEVADSPGGTLGSFGTTFARCRYVSEALAGAHSFGGTVKCYGRCFEGAAADNVTTRLEVYVVSNDGATVRGTLLTAGHYGSGLELTVTPTATNRAWANGDTVTAINAQDGDRIVVVPGFLHTAGSTPQAGYIEGCAAASVAVPEDETTTTGGTITWVEFSDSIVFQGEAIAGGRRMLLGVG
jgi:hypothetical protein